MDVLLYLTICIIIFIVCSTVFIIYDHLPKDSFLEALLKSGQISECQYNLLSHDALQAFQNPFIEDKIHTGDIDINDVIDISWEALKALEDPYIQTCLERGHRSYKTVFFISFSALKALRHPFIQTLLERNILSHAQIDELTLTNIEIITNPVIQPFIENDPSIIESSLLELDLFANEALKMDFVKMLVERKIMTLEDLGYINNCSASTFENPFAQTLILKGSLTIRHVLEMQESTYDLLTQDGTEVVLNTRGISIFEYQNEVEETDKHRQKQTNASIFAKNPDTEDSNNECHTRYSTVVDYL